MDSFLCSPYDFMNLPMAEESKLFLGNHLGQEVFKAHKNSFVYKFVNTVAEGNRSIVIER